MPPGLSLSLRTFTGYGNWFATQPLCEIWLNTYKDWEYMLRYHRSYWKTLLQRGLHLIQLHWQDQLLLQRLHREIFAHLAHWGPLPHAPVRPHIPVERQYGYYGCMHCKPRCRFKAGEGAHLFLKFMELPLENASG